MTQAPQPGLWTGCVCCLGVGVDLDVDVCGFIPFPIVIGKD